MHWATSYIGTPWLFGGDNRETGFDCWSFFKHIQMFRYNICLPVIQLGVYNFHVVSKLFKTNEEFHNWVEVDSAQDGDAVLLRIAKYPNHVGVWISDGETIGVLHAVENMGVIFSSLQNLDMCGWKISSFYRHKSKI